jgi:hypothetical protein
MLGEQRRVQITVGMVPYRRQQGPRKRIGYFALGLDLGEPFSLEGE